VTGEREDLDGAQGAVGHHVLRDDSFDEGPDGGLHLLARLRAALLDAGLGPDGLDVAATPDPEGRTLAAALVLLYPWRAPGEQQTSPYLVLTRRTTAMRRHSGQISLPGGRHDAEDGSLLATALRETEEELGIPPDGLEIWGRLEPEWIVVTHYLLAPFVAYTSRRPAFRPAPAEVAEVIEMPLALLLDPASLAEEIWEMQGGPRQVSFYRHGEHKVWGATARVLGQVAALLDPTGGQPPVFPGAAGETDRPRLAPGDVWPPRMPPRRQP
jgi:8-oxo-dGTP pyrophosphatase MutT (NUDIX family)